VDVPCAATGGSYPASALVFIGSAPAADGSLTFKAAAEDTMGPILFTYGSHYVGAIVIRATNGKAVSGWVVPKNGTASDCYGCTY
jgi:hypothetical protein